MIAKDEQIKHVWRTVCDGDCGGDDAVVTPDWYQVNGTPMCPCGEDMEYSHTDITMTPEDLIAELTIMFATSRIREEHITSIGHQIGRNFWSGAALTAIIEESKVKEIQRLGNKPMWVVFGSAKNVDDEGNVIKNSNGDFELTDVNLIVESEGLALLLYKRMLDDEPNLHCAGYAPIVNGTEPQWLDGGE